MACAISVSVCLFRASCCCGVFSFDTREVCIDPNLEFLCKAQTILWWIFCLCGLYEYSAKIHYVHDWSLWVDTHKATSYLDHFCARVYILLRTQIFLIMILAF